MILFPPYFAVCGRMTYTENLRQAKEYYETVPEWVWNLPIVMSSVRAGLHLTNCGPGYKMDGIHLVKDSQSTEVGLLCLTVTNRSYVFRELRFKVICDLSK